MAWWFSKKKHVVRVRRVAPKRIEEPKDIIDKNDIKLILSEISLSRDMILRQMHTLPDQLSSHLVNQVTAPLKQFLLEEFEGKVSASQALEQQQEKRLSASQAVTQKRNLDQVVRDMKDRLEKLSQRHVKILNILVQHRESWLSYDEVGERCDPRLTGSCIRGYIADLINSYDIPIEKRNVGKKSKVRIAPHGVKHLAIARLVEEPLEGN